MTEFVTVKGVKVKEMSPFTPKDNPDKTYYTLREDRGIVSPKWSMTVSAYNEANRLNVDTGSEVDIDVELTYWSEKDKFTLGKVIAVRLPEEVKKNGK